MNRIPSQGRDGECGGWLCQLHNLDSSRKRISVRDCLDQVSLRVCQGKVVFIAYLPWHGSLGSSPQLHGSLLLKASWARGVHSLFMRWLWVWPAASNSCLDFPATMDYGLEFWAKQAHYLNDHICPHHHKAVLPRTGFLAQKDLMETQDFTRKQNQGLKQSKGRHLRAGSRPRTWQKRSAFC